MQETQPDTPLDPGGRPRVVFRTIEYAPDPLPTPAAVGRIVAGILGGAAFALVAWMVLHSISLPAFNTSMVTRALATGATFVVALVAALFMWGWSRHEEHGESLPRWRRMLAESVATLTPPALVVTNLGIPLAATRLYLDGIQVDQGFRTQFLSRMTEQFGNHDMSYADLPTFYPLGWFWLGGRMANFLGMPGWQVYQPWAIVSLAAAAGALVPVWRKLTASLPVATAIAGITIAVVLAETPDEPYAAIVAMFVPAAAIASYKALSGSWSATVALMVYLGISATFYTLFTAISALTLVVFAVLLFATSMRNFTPIKHLLIIGVGSMAIASVAWGPYLYQLVFSGKDVRGTANHFLPIEGTTFPLPFFSFSLIGLLSIAGLFFLLKRSTDFNFTGISVGIAVCYLWALASMASTLLGTSLLGFRVEVLLILFFVTAGVLAAIDVRLVGIDYYYPSRLSRRGARIVTTFILLLLATATFAILQQIPEENESHIDQAYADTDGFGERADQFPPDAGRYYQEITDYLGEHGHVPGEAVVFTDEINFMAFHPFYGFNAFTSHYANPLGEFDLRNEELKAWGDGSFHELSDPEKFLAALDESPWRAPDAFIFRGSLEENDNGQIEPWKTHLAHDIFPNQPNVRYEALFFNPEAFDSEAWDVKEIGPFVVTVRKQ